jgi:hypothetical protein
MQELDANDAHRYGLTMESNHPKHLRNEGVPPSAKRTTMGLQRSRLALAALCAATSLISEPGQTQPFCNPDRLTFQERTAPVERINGRNVQPCTSGMACINQVRASMTKQTPLPAAYQSVIEGKRRCLVEVPLPGRSPMSISVDAAGGTGEKDAEVSPAPATGQNATTSSSSSATYQEP